MERMDPSTLHLAAEQLREVTDEHARWHEYLLRSIFCEHPVDPSDLAPSAHRTCPFGDWFYGHAPNGLRGEQAFAAMGKEHQRLHQVAAKLLRSLGLVPLSIASISRTSLRPARACGCRLIRCAPPSTQLSATGMRSRAPTDASRCCRRCMNCNTDAARGTALQHRLHGRRPFEADQ